MALPFHPQSDLAEARGALRRLVDAVLGGLASSVSLPYRQPVDPTGIVHQWLGVHDRITSGDHSVLTELTQPGALKQLAHLVAEGLLVRGTGRGVNAHFLAGPGLSRDDIGAHS